MQKYLFAIDLDRTLISSSDTSLSQKRIDSLERFVDFGHHLVFCTARTHSSSLELLKGIKRSYVLVSSLGSVARYVPANEVLFSDSIDQSSLRKIISSSSKTGFAISQTQLTTEAEKTWILGGDSALAEIFLRASLKKDSVVLDDYFKHDIDHHDSILRMGLIAKLDDLQPLMNLAQSISDDCSNLISVSFFSDPRFNICTATFTNKKNNKGSALEQVSAILKISPDCIYAFGDNDADIPMLQFAGKAFLVSDHTIENPDFNHAIVDSPANDGVVNFIDKWIESIHRT